MRRGNTFDRVCQRVCLSVSVYLALTFESVDLETAFWVCGYIFRISISTIYQGHRVTVMVMVTEVERSVCVSCSRVNCLRLKSNSCIMIREMPEAFAIVKHLSIENIYKKLSYCKDSARRLNAC